MDRNSWWAKKLGAPVQPQQSLPPTQYVPVPQHQQSLPPHQFQPATSTVPSMSSGVTWTPDGRVSGGYLDAVVDGISKGMSGPGTRAASNCPACGSGHYFTLTSESKINVNGVVSAPKPQCFDCGFPLRQHGSEF